MRPPTKMLKKKYYLLYRHVHKNAYDFHLELSGKLIRRPKNWHIILNRDYSKYAV
jgi:hypothetical protein